MLMLQFKNEKLFFLKIFNSTALYAAKKLNDITHFPMERPFKTTSEVVFWYGFCCNVQDGSDFFSL